MNIFTSILMVNNSAGSSSEPEPEPEDFLEGWNRRKAFTVSATQSVESILELTVHNTSGTDTTTAVYLDGNIRDDWGDLRFTTDDKLTCRPWMLLKDNGDNILIAVNLGVVQNGTFYIYYDGPAADIFKIANLTDVHYDPNESLDKRDLSLDMIDTFATRTETYLPDLAVHCGDKIGSVSEVAATRLGYYQDTMDHFALVTAGEIMDGVAPGNHDFDFTSFAQILALHTADTWMESGVLYGAKEVGDYLIVSLDSYYEDGTNTHLSNDGAAHQGFGYVNADQLTWLEGALSVATKPVIVFCHHPLSEMDTDQFTLTKETYHTKNRAAVRTILEDSEKVICCIHGHTHYSRNDVINGIPYITITNIGNSGQFGETPATNTGKWGLLDFDASAKTIKVTTEAVVSGVVSVIYEQVLSFGPTSFFTDIGRNAEAVFALGYTATYGKSSILRDPVAAYVTDDAHLYKYPTNFATPNPNLSENTIRVVGRTDTPNFGRIVWYVAPQTGMFRCKFSARVSSIKTKQIKLGDNTIVLTPAMRVHFNNAGDITVHDASTATTVRTYSINTFYSIEVIANVSAQTYSVYIDGVLEAEDFDFANTIATINRIEIVTETGNIHPDNMRILPYTDIAITEFETEETI